MHSFQIKYSLHTSGVDTSLCLPCIKLALFPSSSAIVSAYDLQALSQPRAVPCTCYCHLVALLLTQCADAAPLPLLTGLLLLPCHQAELHSVVNIAGPAAFRLSHLMLTPEKRYTLLRRGTCTG